MLQSGQRIAEHGLHIQGSRRLIQGPESLRIAGIQIKELSNQSLWNFRRCRIHSVRSAKQPQQRRCHHRSFESDTLEPGGKVFSHGHSQPTTHNPTPFLSVVHLRSKKSATDRRRCTTDKNGVGLWVVGCECPWLNTLPPGSRVSDSKDL